MNRPIDDLLSHYKGVSATAIALGVDRQLVDSWKKQGFIPFRRGKEIEEKTDGRIKAVDIWESAAKGNL